MEFYETVYGKRFFDKQLPDLIKQLTRIANVLESKEYLSDEQKKDLFWIDKIKNARNEEEKEAWINAYSDQLNFRKDFNEGWYVDIYKCKCGHYEILQSPNFDYDEMSRIALENNCTDCVLNLKDIKKYERD